MSKKNELDYISRKKAHMKILGIEVGRGQYGGACPKWLDSQREEFTKNFQKRKTGDIAEDIEW